MVQSELDALAPPPPCIAWATPIHDDEAADLSTGKLSLLADKCDLLDPSGMVDPLPYASDEARAILATGDALRRLRLATCASGSNSSGR